MSLIEQRRRGLWLLWLAAAGLLLGVGSLVLGRMDRAGLLMKDRGKLFDRGGVSESIAANQKGYAVGRYVDQGSSSYRSAGLYRHDAFRHTATDISGFGRGADNAQRGFADLEFIGEQHFDCSVLIAEDHARRRRWGRLGRLTKLRPAPRPRVSGVTVALTAWDSAMIRKPSANLTASSSVNSRMGRLFSVTVKCDRFTSRGVSLWISKKCFMERIVTENPAVWNSTEVGGRPEPETCLLNATLAQEGGSRWLL